MWIRIKYIFTLQYWKSNYKKIINSFFVFIGLYFSIIEFIEFFWGKEIIEKLKCSWIIFIGLLLILAVITNLENLESFYHIKEKDIKIKLIVGDIFKQKGDIVLATNTTFDTKMKDDFISPKSLQGQLFLKNYSDIAHLDIDIEKELKNKVSIELLNRKSSKQKRYEKGTVIKLKHKYFKSYWVALADINEHGRPNCCFKDLQSSLESLWSFVSTNGHMEKLIIPILGSGRSALNVKREKIRKEIIYSFVCFSREKKITQELVVCINPNDFYENEINLEEIKKFLEYHCLFRHADIKNHLSSSIEL